jgi:uncharacterized protein (TIGR02246 family)
MSSRRLAPLWRFSELAPHRPHGGFDLSRILGYHSPPEEAKMNRWCTTGCAVGLLLLMAGCAQTPPPPPDTRAADEKIIRDGEAAWSSDWAAKDLEKIVSHYADDATVMVPDAAMMKGKDAIRTGMKKFLADKNLSMRFITASVEVSKSGDLAYTQGTYTLKQTNPKTKKAVTEKGKYVTVYRKQADGSWRAVEDISNADAPAVPAASAKPAKPAKPAKHAKRPGKK